MRPLPSLKDATRYPVTTLLGGLAAAVSVASFLGRDVGRLVMDVRAFRGEPWRALTSTLPHVNAFHLGFNLYWLWAFGAALEGRFGSLRFAGATLVLAAGPMLAEYALYGAGVGLSGVIYGLFGALWVLAARDARLRDALDAQTTFIFVIWFFVCVATTVTGVWPVANVAHGVGALLGILFGFVVITGGPRRALAALAIPALLGASLAGATALRPRVNLAKDRGSDSAWLASQAYEAGAYETSVRLYRESLRMNPALADRWHNLGVSESRLGRLDEAQEAFQRALDLDPSSESRRRALASVPWSRANEAMTAGRYDEAAALYQQSAAIFGRDPGVWSNLGAVHLKRQDQRAAIVALQRAVDLAPKDDGARKLLGDTKAFLAFRLGEERKDAEAARLYEEAVALGTDGPDILNNLAISYERLGRRAEADTLWTRLGERPKKRPSAP